MSFYEKYQDEPRMLVARADREGNISVLTEIFLEKQILNILDITPKEKWNWLHLCNMNSYAPAPVPVINFYIQHGVPVNAQDIYGMTPLHYAMRAKNGDAAIALLEAGANPNIPNQDNVIPLAMMGGIPYRLDVLKLMLDKGGNVHYKNGNNELGIVYSVKKHLGKQDRYKPMIELMEKYA
ncbi:TPA: ankyrin repeat domain-containing protein [Pasteurella multocida]|uniref:ankyrin repeat domain-containing protein n=1 Tax=Avibacterium avium TaxID=751 RepID=UPI003309045D|nr:ankyrin repeat domain-containing protein [Pasteurella multocida]